MASQRAKSTPTALRNDVAAGAIAAIVSLPVCLASGLLALAPLGPGYAVAGAAAGASLSRGMTIGEMALVERTVRYETIVADEHVVGYELLRDGYTWLLSEHPVIATKLLGNLARELARRLRRTSQDLRNRT